MSPIEIRVTRAATPCGWPWYVALLTLLSAGVGVANAAPLSGEARTKIRRSRIVGESVIAALEGHEKARVMVALTVPPTAGLAASSGDRRAAKTLMRNVQRELINAMAPGDFEAVQQFDSIGALAGKVSAAGLMRLLDDPAVARVDLDTGGSAHLTEAVPLMRLDVVQDLGFTGCGSTVAIIDSGVDIDHPDLADSIVGQRCFCGCGEETGCCPDGTSAQEGPGSAEDEHGHGTNVAGIITSNGTVAPRGGAPDANLVAVRVLDRFSVFYCSSDVIAGLDWVLENHPEVRIVNMSLGTNDLFTGHCDDTNAISMAFTRAIDALRERGVVVFASSGNQASDTQMAAPACASNAISVGAVWDSDVGTRSFSRVCTDLTTHADQVTCFSNSNDTTDLFAPGGVMTSTGRGGVTSTFIGTSQASPAAAACAAALLQANPTLSADELESALKASPVRVTDEGNDLTFPRVDCKAALDTIGMISPSPTPTATPVPTPSTSPAVPVCAGDCNNNQAVTIDELVIGVNIVLELTPVISCSAFDEDKDGRVTVNELVRSVANALTECH